MRVVFWQNIASFYQVPHITALAAIPGFEVIWAVKELITPDRLAQGWSVPEVHNVELIVAPDRDQIKKLIFERESESVHIFTGVHLEPLAKAAFEICVTSTARIGLLNEPPIPGNPLRNLLVAPYHLAHKLVFGRRISFILSIGHMSTAFYKSIGFPDKMVFPYGYFPELAAPPIYAGSGSGPVKLMYLGQLIRRKGVDLLLDAIGQLADQNWELTIMGNGVEEQSLRDKAKSLKIEEKIHFLPPASNTAALQEIAKNDVFVLPSRHDGWGAVVNEALICGVPVVCSDHCGAADLLQDGWRGSVFKTGSSTDLADKLQEWITKGPRTKSQCERVQKWCDAISGKSAAAYMASVIAYSGDANSSLENKPSAPWLS